ncbi:hypothetical protein EJ04DRAFT_569592 [Polyplosphaeria fusca]|uniref:Fungal N-terminal domain-containing protein n=1 Tax=Polyplosphaeria fusca TaxID=682080 RepID=A0A9P4QKU9_9PLEO|nr:hypothetical protein EJ04DRAFT_569592 [Polyplosphaeria fusca]
MDPLSIAASIAGLLTITGAIISKGYAHISQAKKNESDLARLLNEIASFGGILFGLKSQLTVSGESEGSPLPWLAGTWENTLQTCEKILTETKDLVESLVSSNSVRLIIKGVSMTSRIERLLPQVERFKSLFILCLQLQNNVDSETSTQLTSKVIDLLHDLTNKQDSLAKKVEAREQAELRNNIIDWLGPTSEVMQDEIVRSRDPQSCQWLIERPEFLRWLEFDGFTGLWLWGIREYSDASSTTCD